MGSGRTWNHIIEELTNILMSNSWKCTQNTKQHCPICSMNILCDTSYSIIYALMFVSSTNDRKNNNYSANREIKFKYTSTINLLLAEIVSETDKSASGSVYPDTVHYP